MRSRRQVILDNIEKIEQWISDGVFENQIYRNLGVSKSAWLRYKQDIPELRQAIARASKVRTQNIVPQLQNAMLDLALGRVTRKVTTTRDVIDSDGNVVTLTQTVEEVLPPNVAAVQICLKNFTTGSTEPWTDNPEGDRMKRERLRMDQEDHKDRKEGWQ